MTANPRLLAFIACLPFLAACSNSNPTSSSFKALTFHASFDNGVDADFTKGDATLYHLASRNPEAIDTGLPPEVAVKADGQFGSSLHFNTPEGISGTRAFYKLPQNFVYKESDWSGTISFWLKLTPKEIYGRDSPIPSNSLPVLPSIAAYGSISTAMTIDSSAWDFP